MLGAVREERAVAERQKQLPSVELAEMKEEGYEETACRDGQLVEALSQDIRGQVFER